MIGTIGIFLEYSQFGTSHYLLAVKYQKMARNIPQVLEGKEEHIPSKCE